MIIVRKYFPDFFWGVGGHVHPLSPVSCAYVYGICLPVGRLPCRYPRWLTLHVRRRLSSFLTQLVYTRSDTRYCICSILPLLPLPAGIAIRRVCLFVGSFVRSLTFVGSSISKTAGDTDSVTTEHLYRKWQVSNGHVPDDVTWTKRSRSCPRYSVPGYEYLENR